LFPNIVCEFQSLSILLIHSMAISVAHVFQLSAILLSLAFAERIGRDSQHDALTLTQPDLEVPQFKEGNWTFDRATMFKRFYENDAYPEFRIAVFKDSNPGRKPSQNMKDEMDDLSKIRGWKQLGPNSVVEVAPVDVTENGQALRAMKIEWIDGDFFDIAKIDKKATACKLVLAIAARVNADDEKVETSEMGLIHLQTPSSTTLSSSNVQEKIRNMYESLAKLEEVEKRIVDLQVMVRTDGKMVVIDPYGVDESPPKPSNNMLGGNLGNMPNADLGNNPARPGAKWAKFDRVTQTTNIDAALKELEQAYQSPQDLPQRKSQTSSLLTVF